MGKKSIETLVGFFVLLGMAGPGVPGPEGRQPGQRAAVAIPTAVQARFDNIGGLKPRAPVRAAGVTVGPRQEASRLDAKTFQGVVTLDIDKGNTQFPKDTSPPRS